MRECGDHSGEKEETFVNRGGRPERRIQVNQLGRRRVKRGQVRRVPYSNHFAKDLELGHTYKKLVPVAGCVPKSGGCIAPAELLALGVETHDRQE